MDGTKRCVRCGETKRLNEFNRWYRSDDGRQPHCRDCSKAYYRADRERHIRNVKRNQRRYRVDVQLRVIEYLREHPCVDCGETDIVVLEFDHVRGEKRFCISEMMAYSYPGAASLPRSRSVRSAAPTATGAEPRTSTATSPPGSMRSASA